jgi:hypothetical protein
MSLCEKAYSLVESVSCFSMYHQLEQDGKPAGGQVGERAEVSAVNVL